MPTKTQVNTDLPEGMDVEAIAQQMENESEVAEKKPAAGEKRDSGEYKYEPGEKTLERLNAMPKEEIKSETGIDIDNLIATTKRRGVLEALAYGSFTPKPIPIVLKSGHQKKNKMYATVRLWTITDKKSGAIDWGYELHPVKLAKKLDKDGHPVLDENGQIVLTYDRNRLTPGSILEIPGIEGKPLQLSAEQVDRLRLTGNLGEPITSTDFNHKPTMTLYSVDPFNEHELIGATVESVTKRLDQEKEFKYKRDGVVHTVEISDRMKGALALGQSQWAKDEAGNNVCIQYNTASGRLERAQDYKLALREEVSKKQEVANNKAVEQSRKQAEAEGKSVGNHL